MEKEGMVDIIDPDDQFDTMIVHDLMQNQL